MRVIVLATAACLAAATACAASSVSEAQWFDCMVAHLGGDLRPYMRHAISDHALQAVERDCASLKTAAIKQLVERQGLTEEEARYRTEYPLYRLLKAP